MRHFSISGVPVTQANGRLVGILTNRDVRFAKNPRQKVSELMTSENLIKVYNKADKEKAKSLLHKHRIEKLLVVDNNERCIGLITVKDIEKAQLHPTAAKDAEGRLRVAAAIGTGEQSLARAAALIEADADMIVVDTAHGHAKSVAEMVKQIRRMHNGVRIVAGNIATGDAA